jgi:hypothetical protein
MVSCILQLAEDNGLSVEMHATGNAHPTPKTDALIFEQQNEWRVILWPEYFNVHDFAICQAMSERLQTLVSTVHVYDDDYWAHGMFQNGVLIDKFCSIADYFAKEDASARVLLEDWRGNADKVADAIGVTSGTVSRYMVSLSPRSQTRRLFGLLSRTSPPSGKAYADDTCPIDDFWVFTDFWRRLGIIYPENMSSWALLLRFPPNFSERLPTGEYQL